MRGASKEIQLASLPPDLVLDVTKRKPPSTLSPHADAKPLTVSMGFAGYPVHAQSKGKLLQLAKLSWHHAKSAGGTCIRAWPMD